MQFFPVFKDFDCDLRFGFMVETAKDNSECASAEFLLNFISVLNLVLGFVNVIGLVVVEAEVEDARGRHILVGVFVEAGQGALVVFPHALQVRVQVHIVDELPLVQHLLPLVLTQRLAEHPHHFFRRHRELGFCLRPGLAGGFWLGLLGVKVDAVLGRNVFDVGLVQLNDLFIVRGVSQVVFGHGPGVRLPLCLCDYLRNGLHTVSSFCAESGILVSHLLACNTVRLLATACIASDSMSGLVHEASHVGGGRSVGHALREKA